MSVKCTLKLQWDSSMHPLEWLKWEKADNTKCWRGYGRTRTLMLLKGIKKDTTLLESHLAVSFHLKSKIHLPYDLAISV